MTRICYCCEENVARRLLNHCEACGACDIKDPCYGDEEIQIYCMLAAGHSEDEAREVIARARAATEPH